MSCFVIWSSPNSLYDCPAVLCSWGPPTSTKSPHTVAGMKAGFLLPPLRDIGPYNSWGLAVPTMNGPFWLSSAPNVLCVATCIIHEGGLMSSWVCCSFARIMGFDRIPCLAGPFVISVVITIPFLIAYPWWPLSATAEETPLSSYAEASWVNATTHCVLWGMAYPGSSFPLFCPPPPFPIPWFLSHAPLKKWIEWIVTLLIFRQLLWRAGGWESRSFSLHAAACHPFSAACFHPGRGQLLPKITTCSESGGEK